MFLTIFTAYQCKVHRVVARKVHPSLLGVGKNYAWATKCPHAYCAETPVFCVRATSKNWEWPIFTYLDNLS